MSRLFWFAFRQILSIIVLLPMLIWAAINGVDKHAWLLALTLWLIPAVFNVNRSIEEWECRRSCEHQESCRHRRP